MVVYKVHIARTSSTKMVILAWLIIVMVSSVNLSIYVRRDLLRSR